MAARKTTGGKQKATEPPADPKAWRRVNRVQLAELLGVHADTVTDYARTGMPTVTRGGAGKEGVYDAVECLAWWRAQQGQDAKEAAQARSYQATAVLNELKIEQQRGNLVPFDEVSLAGQHFVKAWTAKVRALPRQLVQAGLVPRNLEGQVADYLRQLLEEIARWKTVATTRKVGASTGRRDG